MSSTVGSNANALRSIARTRLPSTSSRGTRLRAATIRAPSSAGVSVPRTIRSTRASRSGSCRGKLPAAGDYTICQTVAPPNTEIADPTCKTVTIKLGALEYAGFFNSKPL